MGWLLVRKHPDLKRKGATIDMSDLLNDKVLMFQRRSANKTFNDLNDDDYCSFLVHTEF